MAPAGIAEPIGACVGEDLHAPVRREDAVVGGDGITLEGGLDHGEFPAESGGSAVVHAVALGSGEILADVPVRSAVGKRDPLGERDGRGCRLAVTGTIGEPLPAIPHREYHHKCNSGDEHAS